MRAAGDSSRYRHTLSSDSSDGLDAMTERDVILRSERFIHDHLGRCPPLRINKGLQKRGLRQAQK